MLYLALNATLVKPIPELELQVLNTSLSKWYLSNCLIWVLFAHKGFLWYKGFPHDMFFFTVCVQQMHQLDILSFSGFISHCM